MTLKLDHTSRLKVQPSTYKSAAKYIAGWFIQIILLLFQISTRHYLTMPGSYGTAAGGDGTLSQAAPYSDQRHEPGPGCARPLGSGSGSGLSGRLWLRLCCILSSSSHWHSASVSLGPASLLSVSLSLSPRGPPMMPGPMSPPPAPPGTCYRPSRIILFPVWYSWPLYESGTRRVSSLLEDARTHGVSQVEFDNKSGFEIHTSLTADCILKGKDVRGLENMP